LFVYAAMFSSAYLFLDTGIGALILFAAVQVTMIISGLRSGERPAPVQWLGFVAAMGGLIYLVWPGIAAPSPGGAVLMMLSGIAWGIYSIRGKGVITPVASTAGNFLRAAPLAAMVSVVTFSLLHLETTGIVLALVSGMLTSGLGYVLWYKVLGSLSTTQAAIVQLLVPVLAAFGGVAFLAEPLSLRLAISSVLILGGVVLAVWKRREKAV
jgi:drug/metabolite transporter (DMT)-like permease